MVAAHIVCYFAAWSIYSRQYFIENIPADKCTHINYAFANIGTDGKIAIGDSWADVEKAFTGDTWNQELRGNFNQLRKLKAAFPHLKTMISIGGWTWSVRFSDVAATPESRAKFSASCVEFAQKYGFDGIDLDWEYPVSGGLPENIHRPEDKQNYVSLLKKLREDLDRASASDGKQYFLSVATGAGTERIADMDLPGMAVYLDWINVMTYDFHGGWEARTGHNAPLYKNDAEQASDVAPSYIKSQYNCDAAIRGYLGAGVPPGKLLMGMGLYGRGWQGVTSSAQNGFSQPASSQLPMGTWENGIYDYDHLKKSFLPTYTRYWDDASKVPFLYNPATGIWISYDDKQSIDLKNAYVKEMNLGGAMFWELSGDREAELLTATFNALNGGVVPPPASTNKPAGTTASNKPPGASSTTTTTTTQAPSGSARPWQVNMLYKIGDQAAYAGKVYRCIQQHTANDAWTPEATLNILWARV